MEFGGWSQWPTNNCCFFMRSEMFQMIDVIAQRNVELEQKNNEIANLRNLINAKENTVKSSRQSLDSMIRVKDSLIKEQERLKDKVVELEQKIIRCTEDNSQLHELLDEKIDQIASYENSRPIRNSESTEVKDDSVKAFELDLEKCHETVLKCLKVFENLNSAHKSV